MCYSSNESFTNYFVKCLLCFTVEQKFFDCCGSESSQESKLKYQYIIIFYNYNSISRLVEMHWNAD